MTDALLANTFRAADLTFPWKVVPMVFLGLIAVIALFGAIYWAVGKMGIE